MRVSRLYTEQPLITGASVSLEEETAHYVRTVLRLKTAAEINLFNGEGGEYRCTVSDIGRHAVKLTVGEWVDRNVESPLKVSIGMGIARGDRMDWSIQKAVELGVTNITPIITERCVIQFKDDKKSQRLQHWRKIVQHAAEQSGRTLLPALGDICVLPEWVEQGQGLRIFLDPFANYTLNLLQPASNQITLLTGPEGGFTDREREFAKASGFTPVRLGARILRTETASLTALAVVQMLWGDFGG